MDYPRTFPGRHTSSYSSQNVRFPISRLAYNLDADGGIRCHRETQQYTTKAINKQEAGTEGDALPRVKPPSSLLTQSCLLSSSPDALVRVCLGPSSKGGF